MLAMYAFHALFSHLSRPGARSEPSDYTATNGILTFTPGTTSQTITVPVIGDRLDEADETFFVNLSSASNATIADAQGVVTILDNDPAPSLTINDTTITEGDNGTTNAVFTVSLSTKSGLTVSVDFATANGTATANSDYTLTTGTLSFIPGTTTQTITVPVIGDLLDETDETFFINLTNASNATIADAIGIGTIVDNDSPPSLSINDLSLTEGDNGSTNAVFTVSLSTASSLTVSVNFATANGTATAPSDYTATTGTLTFTPGQTTTNITVPVIGDTLDEANETFFINLTSASNATIVDAQGVGTILDNDSPPTLVINDTAITESDSGTTNAVFTVSLSTVSGQTVTVNYATANSTATAPSDYTATSGTLTFAPGQTTQSLAVPVSGDRITEQNETFFVNLSNASNATIADAQGIGTIVDNDSSLPFAIRAEGTVTINGGGDFDGNPVDLSDDVLIYAGAGFTINNSTVLPVKRDANGNPLRDSSGRLILVDRAVAVAPGYTVSNAPNNQYANLLPPQVVDKQTVSVPAVADVLQQELSRRVSSGTTTVTFNAQQNPINSASDWTRKFPAPGTATRPTVVRVTGGGLNIPSNVNLSHYVITVEQGDINFNGSGYNLLNVMLVTNNGNINLATVQSSDSSVVASGSINMNERTRFAGTTLLANGSSGGNITFNGATTTTDATSNLRVISQGDITYNGASDTRGTFLSVKNFTFNGTSTLYGAIGAKGNIIFNSRATAISLGQ